MDWQIAPAGVPVIWLRSVGHTHTAFVVESFIDELAHAAGKDPFEYPPGAARQTPAAQARAGARRREGGLGKPAPRGARARDRRPRVVRQLRRARGRGLGLAGAGIVRVHRVVCAIDCGPVVNPDSIRAQMEGCIAFGLTAALYGEITFEDGRVKQRNFHDYPMLRMNEMPAVEVHIVETTDKMGGVGEPGVPPVAPAVANAIFAATGRRLRRLPIRPDDLKKA